MAAAMASMAGIDPMTFLRETSNSDRAIMEAISAAAQEIRSLEREDLAVLVVNKFFGK